MHNKTTNSTPSPNQKKGATHSGAKRKANKRRKERANRQRVLFKGKTDTAKKMPKKNIKPVKANTPTTRYKI